MIIFDKRLSEKKRTIVKSKGTDYNGFNEKLRKKALDPCV